MGQGFARGTPLHKLAQVLALSEFQMPLTNTQHMFNQDAGINPGLRDTGLGQMPCRFKYGVVYA
jgi:hypothetical protein|tara:strand:- start:73 stop:264 length:192 start_codon:yes stop_codon:yes gene_type:complete